MADNRMVAVIRYKLYDIDRGLLVEPEDTGGNHLFSDYETMQEAADATEERCWNESVILPIVCMRPDWDAE